MGRAMLPPLLHLGGHYGWNIENRNKEFKCDLAMDRRSGHRFVANDFRLYLQAAAMYLPVRPRWFIAEPLSAPASQAEWLRRPASREKRLLGRRGASAGGGVDGGGAAAALPARTAARPAGGGPPRHLTHPAPPGGGGSRGAHAADRGAACPRAGRTGIGIAACASAWVPAPDPLPSPHRSG